MLKIQLKFISLIVLLAAFSISASAQDSIIGGSKLPYSSSKPEFPGGESAMIKFLSANLKYPEKARKDKVQGVVVLEFTVKTDGSITGITAINKVGDGCTEEAIRVAKLMPKWKPGKQNGKLIEVDYQLPITFTLSDK